MQNALKCFFDVHEKELKYIRNICVFFVQFRPYWWYSDVVCCWLRNGVHDMGTTVFRLRTGREYSGMNGTVWNHKPNSKHIPTEFFKQRFYCCFSKEFFFKYDSSKIFARLNLKLIYVFFHLFNILIRIMDSMKCCMRSNGRLYRATFKR